MLLLLVILMPVLCNSIYCWLKTCSCAESRWQTAAALAWKLASLARNTTCLFPSRVACRFMSWLSSVLYEAVSAQFPLYVQRTKFGLLRKSSLLLAVLCMRMWKWERRRSSTLVSILSIGIVMGFHCSALAMVVDHPPDKPAGQVAAATGSNF